MGSFLYKPYPVPSVRKRWSAAVFFGLFVFLFLQVFQPFGLSSVTESLWPYTLGYGLITFGMTAIMSFVPQFMFPGWFMEDDWTVGREIIITLIVLLFIAVGNWIYSTWLGITSLAWRGFVNFVGYTLAVGIFPVAFGVLAREFYLSRDNTRRGAKLSEQVQAEPKETRDQIVALYNQEKEMILKLPADDIYALTNAENYVELFLKEEGVIKRKLIRSTMASFEELLSAYPQFFRVHRSWIANLDHIRTVDGNARGYELFLHEELPHIPVSRSRIDDFEKRMEYII